ncbi:MAG: sugar phosphate isomerase/epimerase family protein [Oscillospiraceae bacterium]
MQCGISTACFFPMNTLDALRQVTQLGAPVTEVFINTFSEMEDGYIAKLASVAAAAKTRVASVHPCSSAMEGFFFATEYSGRMQDGIALYRRFFEAARALGADKLVFHGDHRINKGMFATARYIDHFCTLAAIGREYGVTLCHENVAYCRLGDPAAVRRVHPLLGEYAAFVLDTKQVHRFGAPLEEMLAAMGKDVRHVHISDYNDQKDCLPPGKGSLDMKKLVNSLLAVGYTGDFIIELYRDGFDDIMDLANAMQYIQAFLPAKQVLQG